MLQLNYSNLVTDLCVSTRLTQRLPPPHSQTEVTQTQVGLQFLDGCSDSHRLVQNAASALAVAQERVLKKR